MQDNRDRFDSKLKLRLKKILAAITLAVASILPAKAVEFEGAIGYNVAQPVGNGGWYQDGFRKDLDLKSKAFMLGAVQEVNPNFSVRASYYNLGVMRSDADATPVDSNYDPSTHACIGPCVAISRFVGSGSANGIAFTGEVHTEKKEGQWKFGAEAGPYIFRPIWRETVYNWKQKPEDPGITVQANNPEDWKIGAVLGLNATKDNYGVSVKHFFNKCTPSTYACLWKTMTVVMVSYRFF